ncbi:alpha/beta fold hydrolase [Bordetella avium]|uniref:alpha/beta fold hydrolase n=1 Tax=Bordetella avium TaxID=521 RepID=UPI000E0B76B0|nr:alpha/beta hydrolase [Bordetella avium]AZY48281.1 alpha/beta hydrolase [Bordetella avium]AZY51665.1 alpha/beta hydrolase [Bordetella avium]RIQ13474.1 alpha/beta fold hydrolase [Bordetella avium]RIQ16571.1 alpha/beta fold hydrolase [Bordetella avium]RIQ31331.1 alpha/beta fold hydrolase [Bordetella avium]
MLSIQDHDIDTGQGRLFARSWQTGSALPPLVLLHDSLGCVALWRDFPEQLAQACGRDVIAYDRLGFGQSDPGRITLDFVQREADSGFLALREHLGISAFVALGHSVGGGMGIACAARHAADCQGLITIAAQAFVDERILAGVRQAREGFAQPGQMARLQKYHGDKAAWVLSAWIDTWLSPEFAAWNLDAELRRIGCPVLALHGDQDEYGSPAHAAHIARLTSGRAHVFQGLGHMPHREKPEQVLAEIRGWLEP